MVSDETDLVPTADKNAIKPIITMIAVDAIAEDIMIKFRSVCTIIRAKCELVTSDVVNFPEVNGRSYQLG